MVNKSLNKISVSGSISVYDGRDYRYRQIKSNSNWFDDEDYYVIKYQDGTLTIKKCYMVIPKNAQKFSKNRTFHFACSLPKGTFKFDENDSNEDELVIYYQ
jgi:hypothetical protein